MLQIIFLGMSSEATVCFTTVSKAVILNELLALIPTIKMGIINNRTYVTQTICFNSGNNRSHLYSFRRPSACQWRFNMNRISAYLPSLMSSPRNNPQQRQITTITTINIIPSVLIKTIPHLPIQFKLKGSAHRVRQGHLKPPTSHFIKNGCIKSWRWSSYNQV